MKKEAILSQIFIFLVFCIGVCNIAPEHSGSYHLTSRDVDLHKAEQKMLQQKEAQQQQKDAQNRLSAIQNRLNAYETVSKGKIAITVIDAQTGLTYSINGKEKFFAASTVKVAMAMKIAEMITQQKISWQTQVPYREKFYEDGTGVMAGNIQKSYSVKTLVFNALVYSDNIAKNMLFSLIANTYQKGIQQLYQSYLPNEKMPNGNFFSSESLSQILQKLYHRKDSDANAAKIYQWMQQSVFHERLETPLTKGKIAHKIGSNGTNYHDIAIVNAKHSYIISVMTDEIPNATKKISEIGDVVYQAFNQ